MNTETQRTGKDYEYKKKFINSDGIEVSIMPDDLTISDSGNRINIQEYKHLRDPGHSAKIMALIAKNNNVMTDEIYNKLRKSSKHYEQMGGKFRQMMNYVEALAKFPNSLDKVIYRCSDGAVALTYQYVLDNLHGIYQNKPALLKLLDKVEIIVEP